MTKYLVITLCILLPISLFGVKRTVQVGDQSATIEVEQNKSKAEIKPQLISNPVNLIPYEEFPQYGRQQLTFNEVMTMAESDTEDITKEPDEEGTWYYWLVVDEGDNWIETEAGTGRDGAIPHFLDIWFNWRYNKLNFYKLEEGYMLQDYNYHYNQSTIAAGNYFEWNDNYNYAFRIASGHMGYAALRPGDPIWGPRMKTKKFTRPDNRVW
ncbi:MAG: hypothetical protein ABIK19_01855 [candidate division WOR-3 bacterium]